MLAVIVRSGVISFDIVPVILDIVITSTSQNTFVKVTK